MPLKQIVIAAIFMTLTSLAARADGMLFTVSPNTPISSRGHEVIQDLIDLEAPVMGLIG